MATLDTDQLCSNPTADQRLCFHYIDSALSAVLILFESNKPTSVAVQPDLCWTLSETLKKIFS